MIADKIKLLREKSGLTQAELAKQIGITRSGVNAWEMGISVPSTHYIVELALHRSSVLFCALLYSSALCKTLNITPLESS